MDSVPRFDVTLSEFLLHFDGYLVYVTLEREGGFVLLRHGRYGIHPDIEGFHAIAERYRPGDTAFPHFLVVDQ